jgi:hypothetical protein
VLITETVQGQKEAIVASRFKLNIILWKEDHEMVASDDFAVNGLRADLRSNQSGGGQCIFC